MKRTSTLADEFLIAYLSTLNQLTEMRMRSDSQASAHDRESLLYRARATQRRGRILESLVLPHLDQLA